MTDFNQFECKDLLDREGKPLRIRFRKRSPASDWTNLTEVTPIANGGGYPAGGYSLQMPDEPSSFLCRVSASFRQHVRKFAMHWL